MMVEPSDEGRGLMSIVQSLTSNVLGLFYEEAQVARLLTFAESVGGFVVPDAGAVSDRHLQFDAPGVLDGSLPVVFFQATADGGRASFSVRLNSGPHLAEATIENDGTHPWNKLARAGSLMPEHNELVFAVSEGSVTFSDVFILYTSNQLTVQKQRTVVATQ
jgi:hypothetical protein